MKFKFDKKLDYQIEAIDAIVGVFDTGENVALSERAFALRVETPVVANALEIDEARILRNVQNIQRQNGIEPIGRIDSLDFSLEMETGTGKTYVYLRTALELNQKYGLKKFIVLVPSVAIREGVLKTIEQTKEHFRELYGNGFGYFAYDSGKLSRVREFAQSLDIQVMIMTIQSFNSDTNIMRQTPDRFNGESPLQLVAETRPVVIMDEPQNMESELSRAAVADLKSLFKLRYSATHRNMHNLMYRLTPVDAYKKGLVKKIEVFGVKEDDPSMFVFEVQEIITKAEANPKARVAVEIKNAGGDFSVKEMLFKSGDDLKQKTNNPKYENRFVSEIDARRGRVELSDGTFFECVEEVINDKEVIFRTQIRETIKAHFDKQKELGDAIKVLSLFFIDRVDNYIKVDGMIGRIFSEEFERLKKNFARFRTSNAREVQAGYFASKKERGQVVFQDTDGKTKADKEVYDLIMKNKERLLSFEEQVCFVFSHSALKEGWDNPNIFQICTLKETRAAAKKRQEIGRGLRLAVDMNGDRVFDPQINVLTVVANESYRDFVRRLQAEYTEAGYKIPPEPTDKRNEVSITFNKKFAEKNENFRNLWKNISRKTRFNIAVKTPGLIKQSLKKINELDIHHLTMRVDKVVVDFDEKGKMKTVYENSVTSERLERGVYIQDSAMRIARETGITKRTALEILCRASNLDLMFRNPEEYIRSVVVVVRQTLNEIVINEGLQYIPTGEVWEVGLFEDFKGSKNRAIEVNSEKSPYNLVLWDSQGEKQFAESLNVSGVVKFFTKLPPKFFVDTPLGEFHPDWAIVVKIEGGEKLYLVRETKFVDELGNLRPSEKQKIACGIKHFESLGVDFKVSQKEDASDLL